MAHESEHHKRLSDDWSSVAGGWRKWEATFSGATWPVTLRMILGLEPKQGQRILDVGCGSGDPALSVASAAGADGQVLAIDLSAEMLETARQRAKILRQTNVSFQQVALEELDEPDGSFDGVTARWSIIFFPNMQQALGKIRQLLKPGGRFVAAVWAPLDQNPMFAVSATVMRDMTGAEPPSPDTPGPHRLSGDGELSSALASAGFETDAVGDVAFYNFSDSVDAYLQMMLDMSPSLRPQLDALPANIRATAIERIKHNISVYETGGVVRVPALARVAIAHKPA